MNLAKTPRSLSIDITNNCNLRCSYCYHFSSAGDVKKDLSTDEWLTFFKELKQCSVLGVFLCGGEPLLREDFKELLEGIKSNNMRFSVVSNGTLVNNEIAKYIKSTRRCDTFQVSLDGPDPETHDVCRGKCSFEKALSGLRCLVKHEIPTTVRVTIHKHNYRSLNKISKLLLDDLALPYFSTNSAGYMGLCKINSDDIQLTAKEYSEVMADLLKLNQKYTGRIKASAGPLANAITWKEMEKSKQQGKVNLSDCGYLRSCGCIFDKLAVLADGTIVPCSLLSHIKLGRINKDSLLNIWTNHPDLQHLRERRNISLSNFEYCKKCEYMSYCRGGCPATAYTLTGKINNPSPDDCYRNFISAGGHLPNDKEYF